MGRPLTAVFVKSVAKPGKYGDRHGLILQVRPTGSKYWFWRGTVRGKRVDYGIGSYPYVTLAEARQTAFEYRRLSKTGADPKALNTAPTFEVAFEKVLAIHSTTWKPGSHTEEQWRREVTVYAFPHVIAHLKKGSVLVEAGDRVQEGEPIGACGNSGNTSEPHIHIHHQRQDPRNRPLNFSEGLPLYFRDHDGAAMPEGGFEVNNGEVTLTGAIVRHSLTD